MEAADHRLCRVGLSVEDSVTHCTPELGPASRLAHSSERACQQTAARRAYLLAGHGGRAQPGHAGYLNGRLYVMQSPGTRHSRCSRQYSPHPPDQAEDAKSRRAIIHSVVRARTLLLRDGRLGYDLHGPPPVQASLRPLARRAIREECCQARLCIPTENQDQQDLRRNSSGRPTDVRRARLLQA